MTRAAVAFTMALVLSACGSGAPEMLDTAQFEELQRNTTHARELYGTIVAKYPGTTEAATAAERLRALDASR
jgi:TolA-binding protein